MSDYREYDNAPNFKENIGRRFEYNTRANTDVWDEFIVIEKEGDFYNVKWVTTNPGLHAHFDRVNAGTFRWIEPPLTTASEVSHPHYYGGEDNVYEAIKVIQAHDLNFCLGNAIKYVLRAGKKDSETQLKDLQKAIEYLQFEIQKG
jgi:hypothetical protein